MPDDFLRIDECIQNINEDDIEWSFFCLRDEFRIYVVAPVAHD